MTKHIYLLSFFSFLTFNAFNQIKNDTTVNKELSPVNVVGTRINQDYLVMEPIKGTFIYSGKKSEVIDLTQKTISLTEKYGRQIFSKIPGVFVYDMDGTGNQINISTRGLDPHRGWEFNNRKDGILTNTDMYGYPASHYNIPMEAVERIELVRGTGSLQYGAQFGGMINYVSKRPDSTKKIAFENINTIGSYGLVSTYHGISGKVHKFRYFAWMNKKWLGGYRQNSDSKYDSEAISLFYEPNKTVCIKIEWTHSNYITHLAGPLTDSMFHLNPKMSTRARNYYNPNIHIPSASMQWKVSKNTKAEISTSAVLGNRNSVMFDKPATIEDSLVKSTFQYNNRQVDIDHFNSYTSEFRILSSYTFLGQQSSILTGMQLMKNNLNRLQQGKGSTASDFDLTLIEPGWGRNLFFKTGNVAFFAENRLLLTKKLSINTGFRIEKGETHMSGTIKNYSDSALPNQIKHNFPLLGLSAQYNLSDETNIYGGWSQAYRPVIFKDVIPTSVFEFSDKNLKDANGYNAEIGFRGKWKFIKWDVSGFQLLYNNRMGTLALTDSMNNLTIVKTNIGNSITKGIEIFVQADFYTSKNSSLSLFTSTSNMNATYLNATSRTGSTNQRIDGNKVESVPKWISRNGLTFKYQWVSFSLLHSYTSESFADALNEVKPSKSGSSGLVPSYQLLDVNIGIRFSEQIRIQLNINNASDVQYFTKRPQFYPGPGIWPSDGRTFSGTIFLKL